MNYETQALSNVLYCCIELCARPDSHSSLFLGIFEHIVALKFPTNSLLLAVKCVENSAEAR